MKKILLPVIALAASIAVQAQTVYFSDDFEWLAPWSAAVSTGDAVGTDDEGATAPQLKTPKVEIDGQQVSAYQALLAQGYTFTPYCASSVTARKAEEQSYLQKNYLKFGLTKYQTAITLPSIDVPAGTKVILSFDWCSQRQGSGAWDATQLVVVVANGETETQFPVPVHEYVNDDLFEWIPTEIKLGDIVTKDSKITIRNIDAQLETAKAYRYYLDNIYLVAENTTGVADAMVESNEKAEYYSILGVKVENPTSGLYIKRQGNKTTKVMVK